MRIEIPDFCLVLLVGPSGSGKSHLANRVFGRDEVLASDFFRLLVSGDQKDQQATQDAFHCLYEIAQKRLDRRKLTVIDATSLTKNARKKALEFARENNCFCIAIALNIPEAECQRNNASRPEKQFERKAIRRHCEEMIHALKALKKEGFRQVHVLNCAQEINDLEIVRIPLWTDKTSLHGPFDIIGDVHGCYQELCALLTRLGYAVDANRCEALPPQGRQAIFLGDLCDRGPASVPVLRLVMNMVSQNYALCLPGNHDDKLSRYLEGRKVLISHGMELTVAELERERPEFRKSVQEFMRSLVSHYLLDEGKLLVCHAGLPGHMHGRSSKLVREFCLYGEPTGNLDEFGLPERGDWARDYEGNALVAYGHCPDLDTHIVNNTICLDSGCVFGGKLAALRYPEMEIVAEPARQEYCHSPKPLQGVRDDSLPDCQRLLARGHLATALGVEVIRDEERARQALEMMGRFAADPRWLIYLPPTMSPCETSALPGYLEHPNEALAYYKKRDVKRVICQEKHMGSRAIVIIGCDANTAQGRLPFTEERSGIILTRTGRPSFGPGQEAWELELLGQLAACLAENGFWQAYDTDWVCLDCELLPWSFKAQALVDSQYAPYGIAGANGLIKSIAALGRFSERMKTDGLAESEACALVGLQERLQASSQAIGAYNSVWQSFCKPVKSAQDIRLAPFHILATANRVWSDVSHDQHLLLLDRYLTGLPAFVSTRNKIIDLEELAAEQAANSFWEGLLADGAEGMVVKPLDFVSWQGNKLLQPAIKCRGRKYLRIIYGANYTDSLARHKQRQLAPKRKRALREFALGLEALGRFVKGEPLHRVHECVFTIAALECEPQDARL